jgi:hypothetical protein
MFSDKLHRMQLHATALLAGMLVISASNNFHVTAYKTVEGAEY